MFDVGTPFLQLFQQYIPQGNLLLADRDDPCLLARSFRRTSAQHEVKCLLSSNILLFLIIGFHLKVQCTIFLKLCYRDIVAFRTKKLNGWDFGHWLTANFTFPAFLEGKVVLVLCLFPGKEKLCLFPGRESCACFRNNIPFFDLQVIFYGQMTKIINSFLL